jgi:hypothetical protein
MNLYANLNDIKASLVTESVNDEQLMRLLEAVSRQIEKPKLTGRYFYTYEGSKYYDGAGAKLWLPDDILSISTLKLDQDGDGVYETTLDPSDYVLYPLNEYPKIRLETSYQSSYSGFAYGIPKGIEITGVFGYAESDSPYELRTSLADDITAVVTTIPVADANLLKTGETIRITSGLASEQMFIKGISGNNLICQRGVNGTTAIIHADTTSIYACTYPGDIVQTTLIMAMRAWKRKDSAYQDIVGSPETGQIITSKGIDPDVLELVAPFRRQEYV